MAASDREPVDAAIGQAWARVAADGSAGAAALRLADGRILTRISFPAPDEITALRHEMGAICAAYRRGLPGVACGCVAGHGPAHLVPADAGKAALRRRRQARGGVPCGRPRRLARSGGYSAPGERS